MYVALFCLFFFWSVFLFVCLSLIDFAIRLGGHKLTTPLYVRLVGAYSVRLKVKVINIVLSSVFYFYYRRSGFRNRRR